MIKALVALLKIFLLMELALSALVGTLWLPFGVIDYLNNDFFRISFLLVALKGALYGSVVGSFIIWVSFCVMPGIKKSLMRSRE